MHAKHRDHSLRQPGNTAYLASCMAKLPHKTDWSELVPTPGMRREAPNAGGALFSCRSACSVRLTAACPVRAIVFF